MSNISFRRNLYAQLIRHQQHEDSKEKLIQSIDILFFFLVLVKKGIKYLDTSGRRVSFQFEGTRLAKTQMP